MLFSVSCSSSDPETATVAGPDPTPQLILDIVPAEPTPVGAPTATFQGGPDATVPAAAPAESAVGDAVGVDAAAAVTDDGELVEELDFGTPAASGDDTDTSEAEIVVPDDAVVDDELAASLGLDGETVSATGSFFRIRVRGEDGERALEGTAPSVNTVDLNLNSDGTGQLTGGLNVSFADGVTAVAELNDDEFEWDPDRQNVRATVSATLDVGGDTSGVATLGIGDVADGVGSLCFSSGTCLSFEFSQ